ATAVAVKVRLPDMAPAIRSDFPAASVATSLAGVALPGIGATARDFVAELEARLLEECDYRLEAERQRLFGSIFAGHPTILVPAVHGEGCGARVPTTTWHAGRGFQALCPTARPEGRHRVGAALVA